jgi:four helix bundle protein
MLRIYPVVLDCLKQLRGPIAQIHRRDSDLGRQLKRSAGSVALNIAEGMYSRGKSRDARYHTALGSAREVLSCLEVAQALGYVAAPETSHVEMLNQIIGTLVKLVGV